ncbi:hypothetical protein D3C72_1996500 [compost metagenome]
MGHMGAPGMKLDDAELGERQIALGVLDRDIDLLLALRILRFEALEARRHAGERMALEEAVMRLAGGAAEQRDRAVEQVRQHVVADGGVIDRDIEFGRP